MIEILPNIFAIPVPVDAYRFRKKNRRKKSFLYYKQDPPYHPLKKQICGGCFEFDFDFELLGTCTKEDIDFDCEGFRSALDKAGIDWNVIEKLVIIEKQTENQ